MLDAGVARRLTGNAGPDLEITAGVSHAFAMRGLMPTAPGSDRFAAPEWRHAAECGAEEFYYPGSFNWQFLARYPERARLFNAFDYGHAVLYECSTPAAERRAEALERSIATSRPTCWCGRRASRWRRRRSMPPYARAAWRAKQMFDWAHVLHRQIYDVYADDRLDSGGEGLAGGALTDYYLSRGASTPSRPCPNPWR